MNNLINKSNQTPIETAKETERFYPEQPLKCSKCGHVIEMKTSSYPVNYCGSCGAKL